MPEIIHINTLSKAMNPILHLELKSDNLFLSIEKSLKSNCWHGGTSEGWRAAADWFHSGSATPMHQQVPSNIEDGFCLFHWFYAAEINDTIIP